MCCCVATQLDIVSYLKHLLRHFFGYFLAIALFILQLIENNRNFSSIPKLAFLLLLTYNSVMVSWKHEKAYALLPAF